MISLIKVVFGDQEPWCFYVTPESYSDYYIRYADALRCSFQIDLNNHTDFFNLMTEIKRDSLDKNISPRTFLKPDISLRWSGIMDILSKTGASVSCTKQLMKFLAKEIENGSVESSEVSNRLHIISGIDTSL